MCRGLLLSSIVSCQTVPDVPVFVEIHPLKGWGTYTITEKEMFVDEQRPFEMNGKKYKWPELKRASLIMPATSYAKIKAFIIKYCKRVETCANDVGKWRSKTDKIQGALINDEVSKSNGPHTESGGRVRK